MTDDTEQKPPVVLPCTPTLCGVLRHCRHRRPGTDVCDNPRENRNDIHAACFHMPDSDLLVTLYKSMARGT